MGAPEREDAGGPGAGRRAGTARSAIERIRAALAAREPAWPPEAEGFVPASVLVPVFDKAGVAHLLFTRRTDEVKDHKGEISFPGGRQDPGDASPVAAALREAEEEVGITERDVRILGALDPILTISAYVVSPFVGEIRYPYPFRPNDREIAQLIEVPLPDLLDPSAHRVEESWDWNGAPYAVHYFEWGGTVIWGATAKILKGLLERVFDWKGSRGTDQPGDEDGPRRA